ncbi:MAG: succinylarginine dihydrolase [Novosphingobium sp. 17-62-19]|uniref:N-succinylarginine dihydrolase n=1 Tax=Novosphingobium sp. 17-62-19 TaxID=1970406 RepID=UPI000BD51D29|nr:N-succinylarginine dihydrolase [Novosphingobium sp. 17-62-19]OYX96564.1 MAG: succinylarginine dihydrolase [Novosphingobium sp. 35-62-5]OZA18198.1 MAG: succinylarginine dihydrolase [Novosphingobium sp. 17-62-19]HQS96125.1 N-succinylarginine dihydrolase [Novosphingobium sp.]
MALVEINFDGLVGPSHNYAGLSLGNLASSSNAGEVSYPRAAALQGLGKMRHNLGLGLTQGLFAPLPRPNPAFLGALGLGSIDDADLAQRRLRAAAWSASSMWTANAATVSPAPDTADGRCHLTAANLVTMPHRSQEWPDTVRQLRLAFASSAHFAVHDAVPPCFGDEGAANHMRMCAGHDAPGLEIFVYGKTGGAFPARQHEQASRAVARLHGLDPARCLFVEQSPEAIAAGAFHNDVVAVANERVLFAHEQAFADPDGTYAAIRARLPEAEIVVVPASVVTLGDAIRSYLFNAQLLTLPTGEMGLVIPLEAWETPSVRGWLDAHIASNGPIRRMFPVDVKQSMANGGGPACLRLRVVADPSTVNPRFLLDEAKIARIEAVVGSFWPEQIDPVDLGRESLAQNIIAARAALLDLLEMPELA